MQVRSEMNLPTMHGWYVLKDILVLEKLPEKSIFQGICYDLKPVLCLAVLVV